MYNAEKGSERALAGHKRKGREVIQISEIQYIYEHCKLDAVQVAGESDVAGV